MYLAQTYWSIFFLALSIFTSVTLLSLYEILIIAPLIFFTYQIKWENKPKSWYILLALTIWALICNIANYPELIKPAKTFMKLKFYLIGLLAYYPFQALIDSEYLTLKRVRLLIRIIMISLIAACVFGIIKYRTDLIIPATGRSKGFTQIMRYGYGSALVATILFSLYVLFKDRFEKVISSREILIGFLFTTLGVWASGCRGAVLGLLAGIASFICLYRPKVTKILIPITLIVAISGIWIMHKNRIKNSPYKFLGIPIDISTSVRLSQYQSGLYAMKDNPITGLSIMQLSNHVKEIKEKYDLDHKNYAAHSHNIFIEMGASYGYLGFVLFIAFFIFWGLEMWEKRGMKRQIFVPAILAIIVLGQFENILDANNSSLIFFLYPLSFVKIPESFLSRG